METRTAIAAVAFGLWVLAGPAAAVEDVALGKPVTQSSTHGAGPEANGVNGILTDFTHTATGDAGPWWEVDLQGSFELTSIVIWNRGDGCCQSRLRDITVMVLDVPGFPETTIYTSPLLNPEGVLATELATGPRTLVVDLVAETGGAVWGSAVRIARTPDPDLSGNKEPFPNGDDPTVLSIASMCILGVFLGLGWRPAAGDRRLAAEDPGSATDGK
jgi:hypothetical protein